MKNEIYRLELGGELIAQPEIVDGSYTSINALLAELAAPAIIILDGLNQEDSLGMKVVFEAVNQLRRSATGYAAPIYFTKSMGPLDAFVDGVAKTREVIIPHASEILSRLGNIPVETNAANDDLRVLTFLFSRGDAYALSPHPFSASLWIYEYPAALLIGDFAATDMLAPYRFGSFTDKNLFSGNKKSSTDWLISLCAQGLLATAGLVDRIRLCPHCHTGTLNYIDTCPICGSIDFSKKKMIHCFTCSHVAPEETFRKGMQFVCPRCNVTLRHIGSDYDRPLESYICNSCNEHFIEPEVKADCLQCRQKSATEDLEVRQLYKYNLTAKGKKAVQLGILDLTFSLFDNNRNLLPIYFCQMTDWLLQMKARYSDADFSLLCIKITGIEAVASTAGMIWFKSLIDELAARIRELVRVTDITTTTGANTFWILLPRTNVKGGEILASRLEKLADMVSLNNNAKIKIIVKCFSISAEYASRVPVAESLLGEYEAAMADADE